MKAHVEPFLLQLYCNNLATYICMHARWLHREKGGLTDGKHALSHQQLITGAQLYWLELPEPLRRHVQLQLMQRWGREEGVVQGAQSA